MPKRKKRTIVIVICALCLAALSIWIYWGNQALQVSRLQLESTKIPAAFDGFTIVHLSDLHNAEFGPQQRELLAEIKRAEPDLIAVTGDLVDSRHTDMATAMTLIQGTVAIAPVYYVTGNHESRLADYQDWEQQLRQAEVVILRNESTMLENNGEAVQLIGLDDPNFTAGGNAEDVVANYLQPLVADRTVYKILLSHRPELFSVYAGYGVDMVLSGHAHGGQVRLPLIGALVAPGQGLFPDYTEGMYRQEQTTLIVSRGLGNSLFPFRVNNRPEMVVITLHHGDH